MREQVVIELSDLPMHGMGRASVTWWGTAGFMVLEGTGFALLIAVYLYLFSLAPQWPPGIPPPGLLPGSAVTLVLLASLIPNALITRWAEREDLVKVRVGLIVMTVFGIVPLVIRIFEFPALGLMWDTNAYGSITWTLLGLHTTHLITDVADTLVLAAIMFSRHAGNRRRFGDVQDNALYWNFVVLTWLPIYGCLYWISRA